MEEKNKVIESICYTELVYDRISKKLNVKYTRAQIETFVLKVLEGTDSRFFIRKGKNIYVTSKSDNIRITINSYTFRVITVDRV